MSRFLLALFAFLAIFAIVAGIRGECGPQETFRMCGPACQATCENPAPYCIQVCTEGCFCKSGFVRGANGTCIPQNQCQVGYI
ncbi:chymotrypsin-elastase inhibitor ixodidin [Megachile rotundata]|uniref:chymotrypsin-elastase inhibitor ixodidin n=1 Tax=Megachile rotundata TaxID=143995 RepID=UPI000258D4EE|nr:PREDICTED: chymotrypsin-elastase inhibitor ixodidin-like [Megachile rotundata]